MKTKNILIPLVLLLTLPSLASTEKEYLCGKEESSVEITLSTYSSSCHMIISINDPETSSDSLELINYENIDTCTANLETEISKYTNEGYNCHLIGQHN
ncbi:MAG: hypothetical protein OXK80_00520 [Bdellovibrionales bacterium]|nr:hypothetical protein [Bdellovibrionales bacterium]